MRAAVLTAPFEFTIMDVARPTLRDSEVLIRVKAAGICGSDLHSFRGKNPFVKMPRVVGHELSGEAEAVGRGVEKIRVGDKVVVEPTFPCGRCRVCKMGAPNVCPNLKVLGGAIDGAFQEYLSIPEDQVHLAPRSLSFEEVTLIEPYAVATHILERSGLRLGEALLILGAGPIGLCVLQVARLAGAGFTIVTDVLDYRLQLAERLGADMTINANQTDLGDALKDAVGGEGVDLAVEAVGHPLAIAQALRFARPRARIVLAGFPEDPSLDLDVRPIVTKELHVIGSRLYWLNFKAAIQLVSEGKVDTRRLITHRFTFSEIQKAFETADGKTGNPVKVVVTLP